MERREFVKAAVAIAGTFGLTQAVKAGDRAGETLIGFSGTKAMDDSDRLRMALLSEFEAVEAYDSALGNGHLKGETRELAKKFKQNHEEHIKNLNGVIKGSGGSPLTPQKTNSFAAAKLSSPLETVRFVYRIERRLAESNLQAAGDSSDSKLRLGSAKRLADNVLHATAWARILWQHSPAGGFDQLPA